jgi:hypothetical protein
VEWLENAVVKKTRAQCFSPFLSAGLSAALEAMLYFTKRVCWLVPKQLTDLWDALEPADKKRTKKLG